MLDIIDKHYNWTDKLSLGKLVREGESHLYRLRNTALSKTVDKNTEGDYSIGFHVDRIYMGAMPKEFYFNAKESTGKLIEIEKPEGGGLHFKSKEGEFSLRMNNSDLYI